MLSREFGTRLTGRYKSFEVYPFSFKEFLDFKKVIAEKGAFYHVEKKVRLLKLFEEYLSVGGLPEYLRNQDTDYVRTVYENILYKDIITRYSIKREKIIKELVNILATNATSPFTYNSLKKALGLSNAITVKEYISYLNNSYLFFELQKFDFSIRKQLSSPKKIYLIDPVFSTISGFNFSANKGKVLENVVFIELKRRGNECYYYSNKNECDFVVTNKNKVISLIQVCFDFNEETKEREINGIITALKEFNLKEGLILTYNQEDEFSVEGRRIIIKPVWKWLNSL